MDIKFEKKEIEHLKGILKYHPDGENAVSIISELMDIQELAGRLKYPINTFGELQKQLGEKKELKIGDTSMPFSETRKKIPAYYFPITCEEDLMDKASELLENSRLNAEPQFVPAEEISVENAPPLPKELLHFRYQAEIPATGSKGMNIEDVIKLSKSGEVK